MSSKYDILIWVCVLMAFFLILVPVWMYKDNEILHYGSSPTKHDQAVMLATREQLEQSKSLGADSVSIKIESIRLNQLQVLKEQDKLINDFRQEMNNNINKINTWLAYAIGIMSLVGVFIPIAIQFKVRSDEKELSERHERELSAKLSELDNLAERNECRINATMKVQKDEISTLLSQIDTRLLQQQNLLDEKRRQLDQFSSQIRIKIEDDIQSQKDEITRQLSFWDDQNQKRDTDISNKLSEIDRKFEQLDKEAVQNEIKLNSSFSEKEKSIDEIICTLERENQLQRLWSRFMTFSCCSEDIALDDLSDRSVLMKYIWNKIAEMFSDIVTKICGKTNVDELDRISIIMSLAIMNSIILKIKNNPDIEVYRNFDSINDEVHNLLGLLMGSIDNHAAVLGVSDRLKKLNNRILSTPLPT